MAIPLLVLTIALAGCGARGGTPDPKAEASPAPDVIEESDASMVKVDHPEQFPLVTAAGSAEASELQVTGVVSVDVSRNVPVISLASGRVVEIHAKLGDQVSRGQLLMRVQSNDIASAFSDYHHALADQTLAKAQLSRAQLLYDKGAAPQKDLEVASDAAQKADVDVQTALDHLKVLGADPAHPTSTVDITAPITGVIVEQNVTDAAGVKTLDNSPNLFTISDLSNVWVMCDVYENDLAGVHLGEFAEIRANAFPDRELRARIDNIGPALDPNTRAAKVRLQLANPGFLRLGMFVTAAFHGQKKEMRAVVPSTAVLHLHDRDWVYTPAGEKTFRRLEVVAGRMTGAGMQEILSGLAPGTRVVSNALVLQNTADQ